MTYRLQSMFLLVAVTAILTLTFMTIIHRLSDQPTFSCDAAIVHVAEGDTLLSLVRTHCTGSIEAAVAATITLNGGSTIVHPASTLRLPADAP